jgi:hypothetical protein
MELTEIEILQVRCRALGYAPDAYLFRVTVKDVLTLLAERLTRSGTSPDQLTQPDLDQLLDQVAAYLNGEGNPWHQIVALGLDDGWPKTLLEPQEVP